MSLMTVSSESAEVLTMLEIFALFGGELCLEGQFRHADDSVHGRADFVAHVGQEFAFGAAGGFRGLFRVLQFLFRVLALGDIEQAFLRWAQPTARL